MPRKLHELTILVQQRVSSEFLDRNCPGKPLWPWSLFLAQNSEDSRSDSRPPARSKQSEMPYRVPIEFGDVP